MKERGMIFNGEMVRAILDGRKTQTRRMLTPRQLEMIGYAAQAGECYPLESGQQHANSQAYYREWCPFGQLGDCIWVRETWADVNHDGCPAVAYRADGEVRDLHEDDGDEDDPRLEKYWFAAWYPDLISGTEGNWKPSIHMPRWASRITLEITGVRVERLQDISEEDAEAEGIDMEALADAQDCYDCIADHNFTGRPTAAGHFSYLWQSIYGAESWQANPWVWVVEFRVIENRT